MVTYIANIVVSYRKPSMNVFSENIISASKKIKPIIKWTGGKFNEFNQFSDYLPGFEKYFEPFFGGGGVFFALQPAGEAYLNDKSEDLIKFYRLTNSDLFKKELFTYCDAWDEAGILCEKLQPELFLLDKACMAEEISPATFNEKTRELVWGLLTSDSHLLFDASFIVDPKKFFNTLTKSIGDKSRRIKNIAVKKGRLFTDEEMADHIETGIKSGLYLFLRQLTNLQFKGSLKMTDEKATANWYFVREFCYASMFRYNRTGGFNIPYGGIAYNRKNFRQKVESIFSPEVKSLFANSTFYNLDFAAFLKETPPGENDFIFLDPPYDSEFSEYDQNSFTKQDQVRLRDVLFETRAKWMLVIKETEFIRSLYTSDKCSFIEFDKTYTYNVRGRNNRETRHLIIINYQTEPGFIGL